MAGYWGTLGVAAAGGGSSFDPLTDMPGLQVWLDASDASTFTFGTGTQVATWADKSANAFSFSRTASTAIQRNGTQNGLTTVDISAAGKLAVTPGTAICGSAFTIFVVFIKKGAQQAFEALPFTMTASNVGRPLDGYNNTRQTGVAPIGGSAYTNIKTQTSLCQLTFQFDNTSDAFEERKDGASVTSGTDTDWAGTASQVLTVGSRGDSATQFMGEVCEILVSDQYLTGTDITDAEDYLSAKWGTP